MEKGYPIDPCIEKKTYCGGVPRFGRRDVITLISMVS
jgi:hypothetical protein